ncbi:HlyC/CorC family transporter [Candidatus Woesearchaeota archaeon]|nr:HlyC/CorC family transporter [Candidatus Woesearchaeota archaeon]
MALGTEIILLIILLILSGFFSGAEVALVSLSRLKCKRLVEEKKSGSLYVQKLKEDTPRMLGTILLGNNVVNVAASAIATSVAIRTFDSFAIGIVTGVMTFLILVFGELTPKLIASHHNEFFSRMVAGPLWYLSIILSPILSVLNFILGKVFTLFGIKPKESKVTEEEIISMVKIAREEGTIKEMEKNMIHSIFEFDDMDVEEITTPRADMIAIDSKCTVKQAMKVALKKNFSRIPVFEKTNDNIIGIVYVKDLMAYLDKKKDKVQISKVMKRAYFVPETKKISNLLRQFQKRKEHMAVVVDEHGSVSGIVTLEDVLEEIVGEIMDETDKVDPHIRKIGNKIWIVKGKTEIDEINEKLKMNLKGEDYDTFSGFILKYTGKIPNQGEEIAYKKFKLKIENIAGQRISKVRVEKK